MSKSPVSERRLAANRANAAKSTGPQTPEGKARSRQNSRKHNFNAATFAVVRLEELDALAKLRDDAVAVYRPVNSQELFAVERIALAQLSLLRVAALEAGFHTAALNETIRPGGLPANLLTPDITHDIKVSFSQNRSHCLAVGFQRLTGKSDSFKLLLRYQAQSERFYRRAIEEFDRLKSLRDEFPNEPIADSEPDETTEIDDIMPPSTEPYDPCLDPNSALYDPSVAVPSSEPPPALPRK